MKDPALRIRIRKKEGQVMKYDKVGSIRIQEK